MTQVAADATSQTITYRRDECAIFMRSRDKHGDLSNMTFEFPLLMNQVRFQGPEGLYQSLKFPHRPHHQLYIAQQRSGMDAKRAAYEIDDARPDWDEVRVTAMACTLAVKLAQHPRRFAHALLATGAAPIVEMSRRDAFWGAVPDGNIDRATTLTGNNALGKILTALRNELAANPTEPLETARRFCATHHDEGDTALLVIRTPITL